MKKLLAVAAAVAYVVSPLDLVPDIIPILGWLDDIGVIALLVNYLNKKPGGPVTT